MLQLFDDNGQYRRNHGTTSVSSTNLLREKQINYNAFFLFYTRNNTDLLHSMIVDSNKNKTKKPFKEIKEMLIHIKYCKTEPLLKKKYSGLLSIFCLKLNLHPKRGKKRIIVCLSQVNIRTQFVNSFQWASSRG